MRAVQWHEQLVVHVVRRADRDEPPADCDAVTDHAEVLSGMQHRPRTDAGGRVVDDLRGPVLHVADDDGRAFFDDAGLLGRDRLVCVAEELGVVEADRGDHGDDAVGDVGRVPRAAEADLDDGRVDGEVGEPREPGRSYEFEPRRAFGEHRLEARELFHDRAELVIFDRVAVPQETFGDRYEVRARVGADRQVVRGEQSADRARGRRLAVGAGDVDDGYWRCGSPSRPSSSRMRSSVGAVARSPASIFSRLMCSSRYASACARFTQNYLPGLVRPV